LDLGDSCLPAGRGIYLKFAIWDLVLTLVISLIREGFINEHHRDIFPNRVNETTPFTDQPISCPVQENISFTLRAR